MRFRGRIGADQLQLISDVVQAMYRQGEFLCLKLTPTHLHAIVNCSNSAGSNGVIPTFAKFNAAEILFFEYLVESNTNNEICLECDPLQFLRASRSVKEAPEVLLTLKKRQEIPRIVLEATMINGVRVTQDVPVRVLNEDEFQNADEPVVDPPKVRIMLPKDVLSIRSVADKLRIFGKYVSIIADLNGCLELNSHSDAVNIRSIYTDLQAQGIIDANQNTSQTGQVQLDSSTATGKTSVVVDSRQLSQALKCTSVRHDRVLFCLTPGEVCIVYLAIFNSVGTLVFYLPAIDGGICLEGAAPLMEL